MGSIFKEPDGLEEVAHFSIQGVDIFSDKFDAAAKAKLVALADLPKEIGEQFEWYAFSIIVHMYAGSMNQFNIDRLDDSLVDAFVGSLYPSKSIRYVRGIQVEANWTDEAERTEVRIIAKPI